MGMCRGEIAVDVILGCFFLATIAKYMGILMYRKKFTRMVELNSIDIGDRCWAKIGYEGGVA
jgi:hypothetical protein